MSSVPRNQSDSEDDDDYIPPTRGELNSNSEDESQLESQQVEGEVKTAQETEDKQKERDAVWADFQASIASSTGQKIEATEKKGLVKIQKKYLFAGKYITEVVEVPEDSQEAKKWPLYSVTEEKLDSKGPIGPRSAEPSFSSASSPATNITSSANPPLKKPGPRKRKTVLDALPSPSSQKAKKLTTLDKSLMDWKTHTQGTELQDELEANRKGGGYLEKVEFLQRVEGRKEETLEALKSRKRRKL